MNKDELTTDYGGFQGWMTAGQAADHAKVSRVAMHQWMHGGLVRSQRMGKFWYVFQASLDAFLRVRASASPNRGETSNGKANNRKRAAGGANCPATAAL